MYVNTYIQKHAAFFNKKKPQVSSFPLSQLKKVKVEERSKVKPEMYIQTTSYRSTVIVTCMHPAYKYLQFICSCIHPIILCDVTMCFFENLPCICTERQTFQVVHIFIGYMQHLKWYMFYLYMYICILVHADFGILTFN